MPSLRYRRVDQVHRGNIVSERTTTNSSTSASQSTTWGPMGSTRSLATSSSSGNSQGSVVAFHAGHNVLEKSADGALRPGRLLSQGRYAVIIDASESVATAPNQACRGLEGFVPQWKGAHVAMKRYTKSLDQRHVEGSLRSVTNLGRKLKLHPAVTNEVRRYNR